LTTPIGKVSPSRPNHILPCGSCLLVATLQYPRQGGTSLAQHSGLALAHTACIPSVNTPRKTRSEDHRGTPENPGRVVTLIERSYWASLVDHHAASADDKVWGTAYRIRPDKVDEVKDYLDIREINGYTIHHTPFYPADGTAAFAALVYIGTPDNAQFTGPQDVQALAEHIHRSEGPSGLNKEYLWELEAALNELSPESGDEHVSDLSRRVRDIEAKVLRAGKESRVNGTVSSQPETPPREKQHEFQKVSSIEEQEETEKAV
jgi:glutathione-specific gamma-glutamylcyclotransferase